MIREYLMPFFYLAAAFMLFFYFAKENRGFYIIGAGFSVLGLWEAIKLFTNDALTTGFLAYVPRIIGAVLLVFACYLFVNNRKNDNVIKNEEQQNEEIEDNNA